MKCIVLCLFGLGKGGFQRCFGGRFSCQDLRFEVRRGCQMMQTRGRKGHPWVGGSAVLVGFGGRTPVFF